MKPTIKSAPKLLSLVLAVVLAVPGLALTATAQDLIRYNGSDDLGDRLEWARSEGERAGGSSGYWIGYTFTRMMCENCYTGTYYDTDWDGLPTLGERISGIQIDDDYRAVRDAARRTLDNLEGGGPLVEKQVAVLLDFDQGNRWPSDLEMTNLSMAFDTGTRPLVWMGEAQNAESIELLKRLHASSAHMDVRKGALWTIGMHDAPDLAVPFLEDVLSSDAGVEFRKSAAYGLGNQPVARAHRILRTTALSDADREVAKAAVYAMGNIDVSDATQTLEDIVERSGLDMEVRKAALYALGNRDEGAALTTLRGVALGDHPEELQKAATYAIGNIDLDGSVDALAEILRNAPRVEVQKSALYAIGNIDGADAAEFLRETALRSGSDELAKAAVYALSNNLEDNDVGPLLDVIQESKSTDVRKAAVYSIGNLDSPAAVAALKDVLENDPSSDVRKAAVHALGNMDSEEARQLLLALIGNLDGGSQ